MASPYNVKDPYKNIQGMSIAPAPKATAESVYNKPGVIVNPYKDIQGVSQAPPSPAPSSSSRKRSSGSGSSSSSTTGQAEQTSQTLPQEVNAVSQTMSSANNQKQASAETERAKLREAYAKSQAQARALAGEETLAPKPKIEQTSIRMGIEQRPGEVRSDVPATREEAMNRDFSRSRQEFQDEVAYAQNQVFTADGEEVRRKLTGRGAKATAEVLVLGTANAGVGVAKGVTGAVKDVVTLRIIPNTFNTLTEVATNPKGVYAQLKSDFQTNPVSFTTEQIAYGATLGKIGKGIKTGEILEVVKPVNVEGAFTRKGGLAEGGQRLFADVMKGKVRVGEFIVSSAQSVKDFNEGLGKKGQVNSPGKRRISKAEQRYQSRTGYTKGDIARGEKPGQQGSYVKSFTYKELLKNEQLQSRVASQSYPDNLGEYKKLSLVRNDKSEILTGQKKRTGFSQFDVKEKPIYNVQDVKNVYGYEQFDQRIIDTKTPPKPTVQSTSKKLGVKFIEDGNRVLEVVQGKLKVKYNYAPPKKPTLNPKVVEPKKINPTNIKGVKDLISNINEQGKEVFAPVSEPLNTITRGGNRAGGRIRDEIIARAKAKRETQLKDIEYGKELQRQKDTLPATTQPQRNLADIKKNSMKNFNDISSSSKKPLEINQEKILNEIKSLPNRFSRKKPLENKYYTGQNYNPQIDYAPRVTPNQLANTRSYTLNMPATKPRIQETPAISKLQGDKVFNVADKYQALSLTQAQLQTPGQVQGMSFSQNTNPITQQSVFQDVGQAQDEGTKQDNAKVIIPDITPEPPRKRSRGGSNRPPEPIPIVSNPRPPESIFRPATRPVASKFRPISTPTRERKPEVFVPKMKPLTKVSSRKTSGYDVFVRKKGKFQRINVGALSKGEALNLGAVKVGTSASASFKIAESRLGSNQSFKGRGLFQDFYKKGNLFIEKRERRIKSAGEKQEITAKGIQAQKFKKILSGGKRR